jgi:hypothetical protein
MHTCGLTLPLHVTSIRISEFAISRILMPQNLGLTSSRSPIRHATCLPLAQLWPTRPFHQDIALRDSKLQVSSALANPDSPIPDSSGSPDTRPTRSMVLSLSGYRYSRFPAQDSWPQKFRFSDVSNPDNSSGSSSAPLGLNPAQLSRNLPADGTSLLSPANPDRRFLPLEGSFRRLKLLSQNLSSDTCTCISCPNSPRPKTLGLSINYTTKVLYLLSSLTLIISKVFARTPCGNHSTTPKC